MKKRSNFWGYNYTNTKNYARLTLVIGIANDDAIIAICQIAHATQTEIISILVAFFMLQEYLTAMAKLTIKRARKILGKSADKITDEELLRDIKAAEILKNLFFIKNNNLRF